MGADQQPFSGKARELPREGGFFGRLVADPVRFRWVLIGIGLLGLAWVGFVGAIMLRSSPAPRQVAAAPPLVMAIDPLADDSYTSSQTPEPGGLFGAEPKPSRLTVPRLPRSQVDVPVASSPRLTNVPLPPQRDVLAGLPPTPFNAAPMPPIRKPLFDAPSKSSIGSNDRWTALYDISSHSVVLPDGTRLEAHSGLGDMLDDPRYVNEKDRGATPPHLYELTLREGLFHGVQALRLTPIGGGEMFDRDGLLAHTYMLGPNGDSNGCVSFKEYDAFLQAYQRGDVKRLLVVARSGGEIRQLVSLEAH